MSKILATVSHINGIREMDEGGVDLFRINMSHQPLTSLDILIKAIQEQTKKALCIDTEGSQMRTGELEGSDVYLYTTGTYVKMVLESAHYGEIPLPQAVIDQVKPGDTIDDFKVTGEGFLLTQKGTQVKQNTPITCSRKIIAPPFTVKDRKAVKIGQELKVNHYALSFARNAEEVWEFRKLIFHEHILISKIETEEGVQNLKEIDKASDALLIDRGDLSKQVDLKELPKIQEYIIRTAKKPVYVATNFLESMCEKNIPSIAEVNDVAATLKMGAAGLVLAAETAIGKHPVETVGFVKELIERYG